MFLNRIFKKRTFGFSRSPQWGKVRNDYLFKNDLCAVCGTNKKLEVHHIKPFHKFLTLELDENNLITLCQDHHFEFGHLRDWSSWNEDVVSDSKMWNNKIVKRP